MLLSQSEYAQHRGVTKQAVSIAVQSGRITLTDGMIDPKRADAEWDANTDDRPRGYKPARETGPSYGTYSANRTKKENYQAKLAELEYEQRAGLLVSREYVERVTYDRQRRAMKALLAVPSRIAPVLAGVAGVHDPEIIQEFTRRLRREIEIVVQEIQQIADGSEPSTHGHGPTE